MARVPRDFLALQLLSFNPIRPNFCDFTKVFTMFDDLALSGTAQSQFFSLSEPCHFFISKYIVGLSLGPVPKML